MQHSETFAAVATALAAAQGAFEKIPRDRTVKVNLKDKQTRAVIGSYSFSYAPLETIIEKTRPALAAQGLACVQAVMLEDDGKGKAVEVLRTTLVHSSGEWLANDVPIFTGSGDNASQAYASGVTYSRRYGYTLLLCVAADEDDDGNGGDQDDDGKGEKVRPDYTRTGNASGRPGARAGQQGAPVRSPQASKPAADPAGSSQAPEGGEPGAFDTGTGEVLSPWGSDLTAGQVTLLKAKAMAADLTDDQLVGKFGLIDAQNFSRVSRELGELLNSRD